MFGFIGSTGSLLAGKHGAKKGRAAPPPATPVSFPNTIGSSKRSIWTRESNPDLFQQYSQVRKLSDIDSGHWEALNIRSVQIEDVGQVLEAGSCGSLFIPPRSWLEPRSTGDQASAITPESRVLFNRRPYPSHDDFYIRSKELQYENADAFAALARGSRVDRPIPHLAHFRRFWEGLDNMSYYWDDSADEYISANEKERSDMTTQDANSKSDECESRKRTKWNPAEPVSTSQLLFPASNPEYSRQSEAPIQCPARNDAEQRDVTHEDMPETYRGHRIGNGSGMPELYRVDTIRAFVEPIAWAFGFTLSPHRRQPTVAIKTLHVPVKLSGAVWRPPLERDRAKMGWLEGPVLGISCRNETEFDRDTGSCLLDVLRESGALLSIAQERAREKKIELRPGENKWWTTVPRWGGGVGGEVGEEVAQGIANTDNLTSTMKGTKTEPSRESRGRSSRRVANPARKTSATDTWKILRPGVGTWDPRVKYSAVGKDEGSEYDQIFLVSSLNHHISILRLSIHAAYLEYLSTGMMPPVPPADESWSSPKIVRSPWYDLFKPDDRIEALRGVWGVMGYLARTFD